MPGALIEELLGESGFKGLVNLRVGPVQLQFKGSSSDVEAIDVTGSNAYYGAVIKNTATNAGATGGDIEAVANSVVTGGSGASGYILLTLQKIGFAENA
jgi:hypothetical protein